MRRWTFCWTGLLGVWAGLVLSQRVMAQPLINEIPVNTAAAEAQVDRLFAARQKGNKPGVAVGVIRDGNVVLRKAYGKANLEYAIDITPGSMFQIASLAKQFTALSVLLLADEGLINLDDDISEYVAEVPDFGEKITLGQLLYHTSGLRDQWGLLALAGWRSEDVITQRHILRLVSWQKELNFSPGTQFLYSNTGYTLLAEMVARVSGVGFADFARKRIFEPLGMNHTFFAQTHEQLIQNRTDSYYQHEGTYKNAQINYAHAGATSLYTTLDDLLRWVMNFSDPVVGSERIFQQMRTRGVLNNGDTICFGMGQRIGTYRGLRVISHSGADAGYRAFLGRFPRQQAAVLILSNDASLDAEETGWRIADIYLQGAFPERIKPLIHSPVPEILPYSHFLPDHPERYCGFYWSDNYGEGRKIYLKNDTLWYHQIDFVDQPLIPAGLNTFSVGRQGGRYKLVFSNRNGKSRAMELYSNGQLNATFDFMEPYHYKSEILAHYAGVYFSPELMTWYQIYTSGDNLVVSHRRLDNIVLEPVRFDLFRSEIWFFRKVQFVRDREGQLTGFNVSNERLWDLWFKKLPP